MPENFMQVVEFVNLSPPQFPADFLTAMYPKHSTATAFGSFKGKLDKELRKEPQRQRLNIDGATYLGRPASAGRFAETISASHARTFLRRFAYPNPAAHSERGHRLPVADCFKRQRSIPGHRNLTSVALCLCVSLLGAGCVPIQAVKVDTVADMPNPMLNAAYSEDADATFVVEPRMAVAHKSGKIDFASESASRRTRELAQWIVSSKDNLNMPFAIVDKPNAKVYVFEADGRFQGAAPVLLGLAKGDFSTPGIGSKPLSSIPPSQRTTPAGRFVSAMGRNHKGKNILWLDYEQSLSMHAVVKGTPKDRRAERLASPTSLDNRISFGCINVPKDFFENVVTNKFSGQGGIVYILPETKEFGRS
ncbi:L,D-transpeptidase [Thioflavicoccus mobilis]|nr:L,D-transpeptidase [Thioflavicoccus mobilis]